MVVAARLAGVDAGVEATLQSHQSLEHPYVSVVVSTRNHGRWLSALVKAVMSQNFEGSLELIVCDNASTDNTLAIMRQAVAEAARPITYVRLSRDEGPAGGRNRGLFLARGRFIAFTDSDCVPSPGWLRAVLTGFHQPAVGIVQGKTVGLEPRTPLFSHHIETARLDGHFSTSNIVYRADALQGRWFDPRCCYWEDADLGWRVIAAGWRVVFVQDALVAHQVIPLSPFGWFTWAWKFSKWPAKVQRYPGFRKYLFLGLWVRPLHMLFDLALLGLGLSLRWRLASLLCLPYLLSFARSRRLSGKFPPAKFAAHVGWDLIAFVSLTASSIRHRSLVL
ncbi:MAG: glycosyltransferase [Candidatus Dormibacteraeota bacterium]|nr:glycosyltransferase [Candidatus Dormibacteraeota bacterium]